MLQITTSETKKLWGKTGDSEMKPSAPWPDRTWSTQGEGILQSTHRPYPPQESNQNPGILR